MNRLPSVICLCLLFTSWGPGNTTAKDYSYEDILASCGGKRIGFGMEVTGREQCEQAMACAVIASSASIVGDVETARKAGECLLATRQSANGIGWGLGWSWDAFYDGTKNPPSTVYSCTTALAAEGLIRAYTVTNDRRFRSAALEALDYYSRFSTTGSDGSFFFWYSDQPCDAKNVHNASALLGGVYARAYHVFGVQKYREIAERILASLMRLAVDKGSYYTWRYAEIPNALYNDLLHAGYIVAGLKQGEKFLRTDFADDHKLKNYLTGFFNDRGWPMQWRGMEEAAKRTRDWRADGWGIGMQSFALQQLGARNLARKALAVLPDYEFAPLQFSFHFGDRLNVPRSNAHILLAVAGMTRDAKRRGKNSCAVQQQLDVSLFFLDSPGL